MWRKRMYFWLGCTLFLVATVLFTLAFTLFRTTDNATDETSVRSPWILTDPTLAWDHDGYYKTGTQVTADDEDVDAWRDVISGNTRTITITDASRSIKTMVLPGYDTDSGEYYMGLKIIGITGNTWAGNAISVSGWTELAFVSPHTWIWLVDTDGIFSSPASIGNGSTWNQFQTNLTDATTLQAGVWPIYWPVFTGITTPWHVYAFVYGGGTTWTCYFDGVSKGNQFKEMTPASTLMYFGYCHQDKYISLASSLFYNSVLSADDIATVSSELLKKYINPVPYASWSTSTIDCYATYAMTPVSSLNWRNVVSVDSTALPAGMVISTSDGQISGTAVAAATSQSYNIILTNTNGSNTRTITILVREAPSASYNVSSSVTVGSSILWSPVLNFAVIGFNVTPALPTGLNLNTTTGDIQGTPIAETANTVYTVTATFVAGTLDIPVAFRVAVEPVVPVTTAVTTVTTSEEVESDDTPIEILANAAYVSHLHVFVVGESVNIELNGTYRANFSILPELPQGMQLESRTGIITGVADGDIMATAFTVTVQTNGSTFRIGVFIRVDQPLRYSVPFKNSIYTNRGVRWTLMSTLKVESASYDLPPGLRVDKHTGSIIGAAQVTVPEYTKYTVTLGDATLRSYTARFELRVLKRANDSIPYIISLSMGVASSVLGAVFIAYSWYLQQI